MTRRMNGEGSVYKRRDGRYEAAIFVTTTTGRKLRRRAYGHTKQEALSALVKTRAAVENGHRFPDASWLVGDYLHYWLEHVMRPTRRYATYCRAESLVRVHLVPGLGQRRLEQLSISELQIFFNRQLQAGHSARSVHQQRGCLANALQRAVREELLTRNVARLVELPSDAPAERRPWSPDEIARFLQHAEPEALYPAFVLLTTYGLRRGEVLGLRHVDIDLAAGLMYVRQQLQPGPDGLELAPLKTRAGSRDLSLLPHVVSLLLGRLETDSQDLLFRSATGSPVDPNNFARTFRAIVKRAGLRPQTIHGLRHAVATTLKDTGAPVRDVQLILGHADVHTTLQFYQHANATLQKAALSKAHDVLTSSSDGSRCRQKLPSENRYWRNQFNHNSGSTRWARTTDLRLMSWIEDFFSRPLTSVMDELRVAQRQQALGRVAVTTAVKPPVSPGA